MWWLLLSLCFALDPNTTDPRAVMEAVQAQDDGDAMTSRLSISIRDKAGRSRQRVLSTQRLDIDGGSKQIMFFESPADVRGAGLLSIDWDDGDRADDQWLYLPSLGKSTRISSADKSGSFMGTDLTYADMTTKDPDDYDYTMVKQSDTVDGEDCWVIEARPRTDKEKTETGYLKTHSWISKSKLLPVQVKAWVTAGKRLKYTRFTQLTQIDGVWVPQQIVVRTVQDGAVQSQSTLSFSDIHFGVQGLSPDDFSQRRLEQGP